MKKISIHRKRMVTLSIDYVDRTMCCKYYLYIVQHRKAGQSVEHIIISYNEEDQSYGIEGQVTIV